MQRRKLGSQGLEVSTIGLGTMGMTGIAGMPDVYGATDEAEGIATIRRALDLGINFLDTAEVYGPGANEVLLAKALAGRRERAIIATKFVFRISMDGKITGVDGSPENVRRVCNASAPTTSISGTSTGATAKSPSKKPSASWPSR